VLLTLFLTNPAFSKVIYIKTAGDDTKSGLSWDDAKKTVQAAIDAAASGDEVWVMEGTYPGNITLNDGITLFGGFAGDETEQNQRDFRAHETVLEGDGTGSVVTGPNVKGTNATIDGFTVTKGQNGVNCLYGSMEISNNTITNNGDNSNEFC
jgi:hypothetical protein